MGKSDPRPCIGASSSRAFMTELNDELRAITAPTLVITTEESGLQSVETAREYQEKIPNRSEEHTSELQSLMRISYAVFSLKKKTKLLCTLIPANQQHQIHTQ